MAATYETLLTPQYVTFLQAGETETVAFDAGTGANRVLLVAVWWRDRGQDVSATYNSVAMTSVTAKVTTGDGVLSGHLFRLVNPASGSNNLAVTAEANGGGDSFGFFSAWVGNTVNQTTPVDGFVSGVGNGTAANPLAQPDTAITSAVGDRVVVFNGCTSETNNPTAVPSGYTERIDTNSGAGLACELGDADGAAPSVSVSTQWTVSAGGTWRWVTMAVNVNDVGGAGPDDLSVSLAEPVIGGSLF